MTEPIFVLAVLLAVIFVWCWFRVQREMRCPDGGSHALAARFDHPTVLYYACRKCGEIKVPPA